jgi:hypothetical protein
VTSNPSRSSWLLAQTKVKFSVYIAPTSDETWTPERNRSNGLER